MRFPTFPFAVLDTETTGLTPRSDRVLELAVVRYEGGEKVAEYESLYKVNAEMSPVSRALTRINPEDLSGKPLLSEEKECVLKLLEGAVIVGQNIKFDIEMLKGDGLNLDEYPQIDSAVLASLVYPELDSYSLGYLSAVLDLPHEPMHRAMGDVHATTALIGKVWERLSELPSDIVTEIKKTAEKGPEGYVTFFSSLESSSKKKPVWLDATKKQGRGKVEQVPQPQKSRTWLAVKNLDTTAKNSDVSAYTPIFAPHFLLNPESAEDLKNQETFTADELSLVLKLLLYSPKQHKDLPLHSSERDVWKGKIACTKESPVYKEQFSANDHIIIEHRHLLELVERKDGPGEGDAIMIDDASMLEDTATKAFRWSCSIDPLRSAAEGNAELTSFLDAYQIWLEKVRNFQDIRYLVAADLQTVDAKGLKERLADLIKKENTEQVRERLCDLQQILDPTNLAGRIIWITQFRDGGQMLQSVPFDIAQVLGDVLYSAHKTTLLLPPGDREEFASIVPQNSEVVIETKELSAKPSLRYSEPEFTMERLLPRVDGKVVCLVTSKRMIEQLYIKFVEQLEEEGITLVAQGLSGGLGRMQSEFLEAPDRAVWMLTPWMYEGVDIPPETVDHLWIHSLPFDYPSHAVLSIRSERYRDAFGEYFVPRLLHRLFRLLRMYVKHRKDDGDILVLDQRLKTKNYGERVMGYLDGLVG